MPPVNRNLPKCIVHIYRDWDAAERQDDSGGTGFLAAVPIADASSPESTVGVGYVVTTKHVLLDGQRRLFDSPAVVITGLDERKHTITIPTSPGEHWWYHPAGDDIAVAELAAIPGFPGANTVCLPTSDFIEDPEAVNIGDEAFYVGRFQPTKNRSLTTTRFGNVSTAEPILVPNEKLLSDQLSFLIEARTRTGYSGSPAMFFPTPTPTFNRSSTVVPLGYGPFKVLGMVWGLWEETQRLAFGSAQSRVDVTTELNAGMMAVVPAWRILEVLNLSEVTVRRRAAEEEWRRGQAEAEGSGPHVRPTSLDDTADVAEFTREDFFDAFRTIEKDEPEPRAPSQLRR